jgi:hypothetical protein
MLQDKLGSRILGRSSELRFHSKRTFTGVPSGACNKLACGKPLGGQNDLFRWQSDQMLLQPLNKLRCHVCLLKAPAFWSEVLDSCYTLFDY